MWPTVLVLQYWVKSEQSLHVTVWCVFRSQDILPETQPGSLSGSRQWAGACFPLCHPACARTGGRGWRWHEAQGHLYCCKNEGEGEKVVLENWSPLLCLQWKIHTTDWKNFSVSSTFVKEGDVVILYGSKVHILPEISLLRGVRCQKPLPVESLL